MSDQGREPQDRQARESDPVRLGRELRRHNEERWARNRREMLLDLANLSDSDFGQFEHRWGRGRGYLPNTDDPSLEDFRDRLRKIWAGDREATGNAIHFWIRQATLNNRQSWLVAVGNWWWVQPNYRILPLCLAIAVSDLAPKMAVCANPECPQPYFLQGRKTQRFCDRRTCAAYGQREHKRKWWAAHRKEWRERHKGSKKQLKQGVRR
jgi:hypothetical protein